MTPEEGLAAYKELIESSEQEARPLLVMQKEDSLYVVPLVIPPGLNGAGVLSIMLETMQLMGGVERTRMDSVMFSSETWARTFTLEGEETGIDEAALVAYADSLGNDWCVMQRFVRTNEGVRWLGEVEYMSADEGDLRPVLGKFVGVS